LIVTPKKLEICALQKSPQLFFSFKLALEFFSLKTFLRPQNFRADPTNHSEGQDLLN